MARDRRRIARDAEPEHRQRPHRGRAAPGHAPEHRHRLGVVDAREAPHGRRRHGVDQARGLPRRVLREEQRLVLRHHRGIGQRAARDHRARAQRGLALPRGVREEGQGRVLVLHVGLHVDRDALLARVGVVERVEQRLDGARPDARERPARVVRLLRGAVVHALHEPEREVAVDLDEEPPIDRLLWQADRHREEILLERFERPLAEVDLHRQARRAGDEVLVGRAAHDAAEEAVGLLGLSLGQQQIGELEVHDVEAIVHRDRRAKLDDRVVDVLLRSIHLGEAAMPFGVLRVQLDGARRVLDGVVVLVDLQRVGGHPLVDLARALGVDLHELREDGDGVGDLVFLHEDALERQIRVRVPWREVDDLAQRALGVPQLAQVKLRLREHPPRFDVRRRWR